MIRYYTFAAAVIVLCLFASRWYETHQDQQEKEHAEAAIRHLHEEKQVAKEAIETALKNAVYPVKGKDWELKSPHVLLWHGIEHHISSPEGNFVAIGGQVFHAHDGVMTIVTY